MTANDPIELAGPHQPVAAGKSGRGGSGSADGLYSNFTAAEYHQTIGRAVDAIHAGEVFQVNLSQRLTHRAICDSVTMYRHLRQLNPAPFAGYYDLGTAQILSASPERFLQVQDRRVETRPIKGTRRRLGSSEAELFQDVELKDSDKDRAENVMIVDLMRNDLSRVCHPDSVRVPQLCEVEKYAFVTHLVSSVTGRLQRGRSAVDLLAASFPGGSITGAPKVRAMELIAQMEPHARGAYCGSLGYLGWHGAMDLNILIRTMTAAGSWWQFPVGGGIVAQSDPRQEYEETWDKAEGILQAIEAAKNAAGPDR